MTAVHFGRPQHATVDCAPLLPDADTVCGDPRSGPLGIQPTDTRPIAAATSRGTCRSVW